MTEDEAKKAWCPFARVNNGPGHVGNRTWNGSQESAFTIQSRCIASTCMAWRWRLRPIIDAPTVVPGNGYCGLAGNAQHAP